MNSEIVRQLRDWWKTDRKGPTGACIPYFGFVDQIAKLCLYIAPEQLEDLPREACSSARRGMRSEMAYS